VKFAKVSTMQSHILQLVHHASRCVWRQPCDKGQDEPGRRAERPPRSVRK
jgi:hypothetical protein